MASSKQSKEEENKKNSNKKTKTKTKTTKTNTTTSKTKKAKTNNTNGMVKNGGPEPEVIIVPSSSCDSQESQEQEQEQEEEETKRSQITKTAKKWNKSKRKENEEEEEGEEAKMCVFPMMRIKKIIKSEGSDSLITQDAVFLVNKASEMFVEQFCEDAYECSVHDRKKSLHYNHLSSVVSKQRRYDFLSDFVPEKLKAEDALAEWKSAETGG